MTEFLAKSALVIDAGSGIIKAGLQGDEAPKICNPSYVGRPKYDKVLPNQKQQDYYIGGESDINRGLLKLNYPMHQGIVQDWQDMECLYNYCYKELKLKPNEQKVFLTEPILNPMKEKEKIAEYFFETLGVPALFFGAQPVLSLFASGKTTGIVLECGDSITQTAVVYEGYYLKHANQRMDLGGRDVTNQLQTFLRRQGYSFNTSAEWEIVKQIKEQKCSVYPSLKYDEMQPKIKTIKEQYALPDGTEINLSLERNQVNEILFNPKMAGLEYPSIVQLFMNSVMKVDLDLRKTIFQEILLSGGACLQNEFPVRFMMELKRTAAKNNNKYLQVKSHAPPQGNKLCWTGGSILSGLSYFNNMWITQAEYREDPFSVLLKKQL